MATSFDVRIWNVRPYKGVKKTTYNLRWVVGPKTHTKSFSTKALAESFRSSLIVATRNGEAFEVESGLPLSMANTSRESWSIYSRAVDFCAVKWPKLAPKSREQVADAMATVVAALTATERGRPDASALRLAMTRWAFNVNARAASSEPPEEHMKAIDWISRHSLPMTRLEDSASVRAALDAVALRLDGRASAATTYSRKRMVFHQFLEYGNEMGDVRGNSLASVKHSAPYAPKGVDPRSVVNPAQGAALLRSIGDLDDTGAHLEAFFALILLAGLRTAEAIDIRDVDLRLPKLKKPIADYTAKELEKLDLWGEIWVSQSNPQPGRCWTDDGAPGRSKSLKHRAVGEGRVTPSCPALTIALIRHLETHGTAPDGRLFRSLKVPGGMVTKTCYMRVFRAARLVALGELAATPLARRPYDLRHAFISTALAAGVPAPDIARWVGQSIEVLMKYYAAMLYGSAKTSQKKYAAELKSWELEPETKPAEDASEKGTEEASAQVDEQDATEG